MADIRYMAHHHFPQGDAALLPSQRLFDDAFAAARAELTTAWPAAAEAAKPPMPCGFIALATAAALSCAPHTDDSRVLEPGTLIRGIAAVLRAVLAERAAVISANAAPGALGKDVTRTEYLHAMVGQWEVADALRALASSPIGDGVRLCFLRAVHAADDDFFVPLSTDPPGVHD